MAIETDSDGYVNIYSRLTKRLTVGVEADIKTFNLGFQVSVLQKTSWKFYIGIYFLCFATFIGLDW